MNATKELVKQIILFSSILAGFSFAGVLQLLTFKSTKKFVSMTICSLIASSLILLTSTFIACLLLYKLEFYQLESEIPANLQSIFGKLGMFELVLVVVGMFLFSIGIGISGYIRSKFSGVVSTTISVISFIVMLWGIFFIFPL